MQLIANGLSRGAVAYALNVNGSTVSRWRAENEFAKALESALGRAEAESSDTLRALSIVAADRIASLIRSEDDPVALRALSIFYARRSVPAVSNETAPVSESDRLMDEALAMLAKTV